MGAKPPHPLASTKMTLEFSQELRTVALDIYMVSQEEGPYGAEFHGLMRDYEPAILAIMEVIAQDERERQLGEA